MVGVARLAGWVEVAGVVGDERCSSKLIVLNDILWLKVCNQANIIQFC